MTTIIRAESAHDFLALIPALAGYRPERSLVCVAFSGARTVGVLRYDLSRRARDRPALVEAIVGVLCRMRGVDGVVPVAYTDAAFGRRGLPERSVLELLVARACDAGFVVRDAFCVAADGWALLPEPGARAERMPLELIEQSAAATQPAARIGPGTVTRLLELPPPDPDLASAIERGLSELERLSRPAEAGWSAFPGRSHDGDGTDDTGCGSPDTILDRLGDLVDPIALGERIAAAPDPEEDEERRLGADELAWLLHLASRPAVRDAIMLQFAFGPVIGEVALDAELPGAMAGSRTDGGDRPGDPGDPGDPGGLRRPGPRDEVADDLLARLLVGQTTVRPDPDRIERALEVLAVALANAPASLRPGVLCVAAWLAWALGRGSAAGALIDRALAEEPQHRMAGLLHAFVGSGALPEWAFSDPAGRARQ